VTPEDGEKSEHEAKVEGEVLECYYVEAKYMLLHFSVMRQKSTTKNAVAH